MVSFRSKRGKRGKRVSYPVLPRRTQRFHVALKPTEAKAEIHGEPVIGYVKGSEFGYAKNLPVTVDVEIRQREQGPEVSISGGVWNPRHTDMISAGQMIGNIGKWLDRGALVNLRHPASDLRRLVKVWERWHLNYMRPYCEHQRAVVERETRQRGDEFFNASNLDAIWTVPELNKCPICGFKYGTAWKHESVPRDVLVFLRRFMKSGGD